MMERKKRKAQGVFLVLAGILFAGAALVFVILILYLQKNGAKPEVTEKPVEEQSVGEASGSVHVFQQIPDLVLTGQDEEQNSLFVQEKGISVLLFWASWCPHCQDGLGNVDELRETAKQSGAAFFLVDKLDGEKETKEQAVRMLQEKQVETETLFDEQCIAYNTIGLSMIPTLLVVDERNYIISMTEGDIPSAAQLSDMLDEAQKGKAEYLAEKIRQHLISEQGGMRTNYKTQQDEGVPSGEDVLSESQGILMEYAALSGNQELFDKLWNYTEGNMLAEHLMPWVISQKKASKVNALIDDLRILGALYQAAENEMGYDGTICSDYADALYEWNVQDEMPVDFYDTEGKEKAQRFTLCYGDLKVLSLMKKEDRRFQKVYDNTLELMKRGRISEKFPLYYSYYDYKAGKYEGDRLNMAEELTTLLHLAEAGELPEEAIDWLETEMQKGCIYAAYDTNGNPAQDGYFESTAVYALTAMIGFAEGRETLAGSALNRMEQLKIWQEGNALNGLFGSDDGSGIYSFDQGMALLAYQNYEMKAGRKS